MPSPALHPGDLHPEWSWLWLHLFLSSRICGEASHLPAPPHLLCACVCLFCIFICIISIHTTAAQALPVLSLPFIHQSVTCLFINVKHVNWTCHCDTYILTGFPHSRSLIIPILRHAFFSPLTGSATYLNKNKTKNKTKKRTLQRTIFRTLFFRTHSLLKGVGRSKGGPSVEFTVGTKTHCIFCITGDLQISTHK